MATDNFLGLRPDPPQITRLAFHMNHGKERGICSGGGVNSTNHSAPDSCVRHRRRSSKRPCSLIVKTGGARGFGPSFTAGKLGNAEFNT